MSTKAVSSSSRAASSATATTLLSEKKTSTPTKKARGDGQVVEVKPKLERDNDCHSVSTTDEALVMDFVSDLEFLNQMEEEKQFVVDNNVSLPNLAAFGRRGADTATVPEGYLVRIKNKIANYESQAHRHM